MLAVRHVQVHDKGITLVSVLGKEGEYLVSPSLKACTCRHYYFVKLLRAGRECHHLLELRESSSSSSVGVVRLGADEAYQYIGYLIKDTLHTIPLSRAPGGIRTRDKRLSPPHS